MRSFLHSVIIVVFVFGGWAAPAPARKVSATRLDTSADHVFTQTATSSNVTITTGDYTNQPDSLLSLAEALDFANYNKSYCFTDGEKIAIQNSGWNWIAAIPGTCGSLLDLFWNVDDPNGRGPVTIKIGSGITDVWVAGKLPAIEHDTTLDGSVPSGKARLVKSGGYSGPGLTLNYGTNYSYGVTNVEIRNLRIEGFTGDAITDEGQGGMSNVVFRALEIHDNGGSGINLNAGYYGDGTLHNLRNIYIGGSLAAEGNLIYRNGGAGIVIGGTAMGDWLDFGIRIENNIVGRDRLYSPAGNMADGIYLNTVRGVTVGGPDSSYANRIVYNGGDGIRMTGASTNNTIIENYIGTEPNFQPTDEGNHGSGITLLGGANHNLVHWNSVSGSDGLAGIYVSGAGTDSNTVLQNNVGVGSHETLATSNLGDGILITDQAANSQVTNNAVGLSTDGIVLTGGATGNVLESNTVGLYVGLAFPNTWNGVVIENASSNTVGTPGKGNVIGNNTYSGISIRGGGSQYNSVQGNRIGQSDKLSPSGSTWEGAPNHANGVDLLNGAANNTIGGSGAGNTIVNNLGVGVNISGTGTNANLVYANWIGTDDASRSGLGNAWGGVLISLAAAQNIVGGSSLSNVISGNGGPGVDISGSSSNIVQNNWIGTNGSGTAALANAGGGVRLRDTAASNQVGPDNTISGNNGDGVKIDTGSSSTSVIGNTIGLDSLQLAKLPNTSSGVSIYNTSYLNVVGGSGSQGNVIAGNAGAGVLVADSQTVNNAILGNFIGTNVSSVAGLGNDGDGVYVGNGVAFLTIGDPADSTKINTIVSNGGNGINVTGSTTNEIKIYGNEIGSIALPNQQAGIAISGATNITLGASPAAVVTSLDIIGNYGQGIYAQGASNLAVNIFAYVESNQKEGILLDNTTQVDVTPMLVIGNGKAGVALTGSSAAANNLQPYSVNSNGGLPIDLGNDGFTPNDPNRPAGGPNGLLGYPQITHVSGSTLYGATCAGCLVIVRKAYNLPNQPGGGFNDASQQTVRAGGDGTWSITLGAGFQPHGVTMQTFNDADHSTSELSPLVPWLNFLPISKK